MKQHIQNLNTRLKRWRQRLQLLESGQMYLGTGKSPANLKDATKEWIEELKADIAAGEVAVRELEGRLF